MFHLLKLLVWGLEKIGLIPQLDYQAMGWKLSLLLAGLAAWCGTAYWIILTWSWCGAVFCAGATVTLSVAWQMFRREREEARQKPTKRGGRR